jgi:hypothetical protein
MVRCPLPPGSLARGRWTAPGFLPFALGVILRLTQVGVYSLYTHEEEAV